MFGIKRGANSSLLAVIRTCDPLGPSALCRGAPRHLSKSSENDADAELQVYKKKTFASVFYARRERLRLGASPRDVTKHGSSRSSPLEQAAIRPNN